MSDAVSRRTTFRLVDADGRPHAYEVTLHRASEGMPLMWEIAALVAGPLAGLLSLVGALLAAMRKAVNNAPLTVRGAIEDPNILDLVQTALGSADLTSLGRSLQLALAQPGNSALVMRLLAQTTRDGAALDSPVAFDDAYTANYLELARAVWEVVLANRFLPPLATT